MFLVGVFFVFIGVVIHKYAGGPFGFTWGTLGVAAVLVLIVLLNKLGRLHLIQYVEAFGGWNRLKNRLSIRVFFLFNFTIAFFISLGVAFYQADSLRITTVQLAAMAFLGVVPTAFCGMWETALGRRWGSFATLEGFQGTKSALSVPLDFGAYALCGVWPGLACIGTAGAIPDIFYFIGFSCTMVGVVTCCFQVRNP